MNTVALKVKKLSKSFGKNVVFQNVDLEIGDGEFIVLLGPSGCGKTTLLRAISGLNQPDTGEVILKGKTITKLPANKRDIGIVFQNYALFPHMTVKENVAFGLRMRKTPKDEITKRVAEGLRKVHLEGYEERRITQMSGGQQQRVALARALVLNPSLLLMDEPLSNLDAKLRATVRVEIAQIQRNLGITTIMVTHDQVEAMTMGDRIVLLQDGVVQQNAKPIEIYESPANMFVAGFIGSPSINFIPLKKEGQQIFFKELDVIIPAEKLEKILQIDCKKAALADGDYVLGIRPEHVKINYQDSIALTKASIRYMERLGAETLLHLSVKGMEIVALLPGLIKDLLSGTEVTVGVEIGRGHLFHQSSGERV
jgi:ABC-type sugar transport system ATPase subunit